MIADFLTIGALQLLAVISPGPDFAMVVKNTLSYNRQAGIMTALGITSGATIHLSYCLLGLAIVISQSLLLFNSVKYIGAFYLIYTGAKSLLSRKKEIALNTTAPKKTLSNKKSFFQGFVCNLFNPKASLFFLGLFTLVIDTHTPYLIQISYALEIIAITFAWFSLLAVLLTHSAVYHKLSTLQYSVNKLIGVLLILFGAELALFHRH